MNKLYVSIPFGANPDLADPELVVTIRQDLQALRVRLADAEELFTVGTPAWLDDPTRLSGLSRKDRGIGFEPNVVDMRNPSTESVQAFNDIAAKNDRGSPWYANAQRVLLGDRRLLSSRRDDVRFGIGEFKWQLRHKCAFERIRRLRINRVQSGLCGR